MLLSGVCIQLPPPVQAPRSQAARSAPPPAAYAKKGKRARFPFLLCSERLISARSAFSLFFPAPVPDAARLIQKGLIVKEENKYRLNFACFTKEEFDAFISMFCINDEELENLLLEWIVSVRKSFSKFVPKRLEP